MGDVNVFRSCLPYALALGLLWLVPAVLVWYLSSSLPTVNANGQCTGIGFGCAPSPADTVMLYGMFAAPILFLLGMAAIVVIGLAQQRRRRREPK